MTKTDMLGHLRWWLRERDRLCRELFELAKACVIKDSPILRTRRQRALKRAERADCNARALALKAALSHSLDMWRLRIGNGKCEERPLSQSSIKDAK